MITFTRVGRLKPSGKISEEKNESKPKRVVALLIFTVGLSQMIISSGTTTALAMNDRSTCECRICQCGRNIEYMALTYEFLIGLLLLLTSIVQTRLVQECGMMFWICSNSTILLIGILMYGLPIENITVRPYFYDSTQLFFVDSVARIIGITLMIVHYCKQVHTKENDDSVFCTST